jgi:hypothetical protein
MASCFHPLAFFDLYKLGDIPATSYLLLVELAEVLMGIETSHGMLF